MIGAHVLIVGAGHAGGRVAQGLRDAGHVGLITLVGDEPHAPYERPALSKELLTGAKEAAELTLTPHGFWNGNDIFRVHATVAALDAKQKFVRLHNGQEIGFDVLVVATGGAPRHLHHLGADHTGLHVLRTIDDCLALKPKLVPGGRLTVIGGGVIGMEAAASAADLGMQVTVLEAGDRVMARCLPPQGSAWMANLHAAHGVTLLTGTRVTAVDRSGDGLLVAAHGADGALHSLPSDVVLVAVGIEPATAFLADSGIALQDGVLTDSHCRSVSTPWCYAVGDVARTMSALYGRPVRQETWRNAENQARAVARAIVGDATPYLEIPWMWSDQFGHNLQVVGLYTPGDTVVERRLGPDGPATLVWLHEGVVAGGLLIDNGRERKHLEALVRDARRIGADTLGNATWALKELAAA